MVVGTVIVTTACFPMLAHPTRVQEGVSLVFTSSMHVMADSSRATGERSLEARPAFAIQLAVGARARDDPEGIAYRIAGGVGLTGYVADAYAELPQWYLGDLDAGFGVAAQWGYLRVLMPYAQIGRLLGGDWHWFTSQGAGFVHQRRWNHARAVWMPTIGVTRTTAQRDAQVFLTAVIGGIPSLDIPKCVIWCPGETDVVKRTVVMLGISAGRVAHRLPSPSPRTRRRPRRRCRTCEVERCAPSRAIPPGTARARAHIAGPAPPATPRAALP